MKGWLQHGGEEGSVRGIPSTTCSPGLGEDGELTGLEGEKDVFDEGQHPVVLHVAWLTEGLLQFFLHVLLAVKEINFGLLES